MYKLKLHKNLNEKKWNKFGECRQILMIANELNRAKNWTKKKDLEEVNNCYERALELLDLTIGTVRRNKLKELLRFRELLALQYQNKEKSIKANAQLFNTLLSLNGDSYSMLFNKPLKN